MTNDALGRLLRLGCSVLVALAVGLLVPAAATAQAPVQARTQAPAQGFTHAKHAKLFPTCAGCHAGVPTGDASRTFPAAASCASCHDGTIQPKVAWTPRAPRGVGLLAYSHPVHAGKAPAATCASCHATDGSTTWMNVSKAAPETCQSCHEHAAPAHLADVSKCSVCHRPLTAAVGLTDSAVAALPKPPSHDAVRFVSTHGSSATAAGANCATCHARESCARCHVDASRSRSIQALGADSRVARAVAGKAPAYPAPADHAGREFDVTHGAAARLPTATCATCHARASCETCHVGDGARDVLRRLPAGRDVSAPGVRLQRQPAPPAAIGHAALPMVANAAWSPQPHARDTTRHRVRVHPGDFARSHGGAAASGSLQCSGCHAQRFCTDCHAGERVTRRYHASNFLASHATPAYGRETNCSSCHNTSAFCRDCHAQAGLAVRRNTDRSPVFHNAQPLWLLQHGRAARQELATCATCHQQTYCMQCHSQLGSRINPHGPGFDAARMAGKNSQICLACHFKNPLTP